jgi:malonate transporter and related proteins
MNPGGLFGALLPVFFVLALGYMAGKRHSFDTTQAGGLNKLALGYALPSSLFVSMTDIQRPLLLQQGKVVLALLLAHVGLFVIAWLILERIKQFKGTAAVICALFLSTSATPVFGIAVLQPLLGPTSAGTVGLVALAINLTVPLAIILLEISSGGAQQDSASRHKAIINGLKAGLKSPLLWAPIAGIAFVLLNVPLPKPAAGAMEMIGSATSGVALFAVGLTLNAYSFHFSRFVLIGSLARISVQTAVFFLLAHLLSAQGVFVREALVCCSFPMATIVVLFATKYKSLEGEAASILLLSTLSLLITVPLTLAIGG